MILCTTDTVPGRTVRCYLGLAKGCSVRGAYFGDDVVARIKNALGGEIHEYTAIFAQAREQALDRLIADALSLGADAIVGLRFCSVEIATGVAELQVYGTAVSLDPNQTTP
ncbi:MAG: YbjQ family protein [Candidatus Sumerlaeia bacterium]|nr:YbjQ family protein [Candidatus Sumerlaeia bacterium]